MSTRRYSVSVPSITGSRSRGSSPWTAAQRWAASTSMGDDKYDSQDRGDAHRYQAYMDAMDAVSREKVASASAFFQPRVGGVLVDVGMASGTSTALLGQLFPHAQVVGVDINPKMAALAKARYGASAFANVSFRVDDGETLSSLADLEGRIDGFFNCSSLHHVTSYGGYDSERALRALARQAALLSEGGVLVVRDFVKPEERDVVLELRTDTMVGGSGAATGVAASGHRPSDADLLVQFSQEARSLAPSEQRGFPLQELPATRTGWRRFRLFYTDATEFIRRMDYYEDWAVELQEEYGYLSQRQFEDAFVGLGMRVMLSAPLYNRWIVRNRYQGRFRLLAPRHGTVEGATCTAAEHGDDTDEGLVDMGYPPTNYLVAAEKVTATKGRRLDLVRHLPMAQPTSYLTRRTFMHGTAGRVYDVVRRPSDVVDIIPYSFSEVADGHPQRRLMVVAKHGYPRPLLSLREDGAAPLDGKWYSGYTTEAIATATEAESHQPAAMVLQERCGLSADLCLPATEQVLYGGYFPSAGGLAERVTSKAVQLHPAHGLEGRGRPMSAGVSGFAERAQVRAFDAQQLLLSAQTGALVEARLEMNLYRLFRLLAHPLPPWLGEKMSQAPHATAAPPAAFTRRLTELLSDVSENPRFADITDQPCHVEDRRPFLSTHRAVFAERGGPVGSQNVLEYVLPRTTSVNTLLTLPLWTAPAGDTYVGLEVRELPVPQLYPRPYVKGGGSSCRLLTVPARRLPRHVTSVIELERYLVSDAHQLNGARRVVHYRTLGAKYFPSIGVTPEQVYPYVVWLEDTEAAPTVTMRGAAAETGRLMWVAAEELFANMDSLEDGHLLIALSRLQHALT